MTAPPLRQGDRVWYWAKRKFERAHIKQGIVRDINLAAGFARVEITNVACPVQTVSVGRLKRVVAGSETARLLFMDAKHDAANR